MNPRHPSNRSTPSRRDLLKTGGIAAMGLSLPRLLQSQDRPPGPRNQENGSQSSISPTSARTKEISCIFIHQYGGLSQLDSWDPKPLSSAEIRGPYSPIQTVTPGFQISELMPKLSQISDKYSVIRSMTHGNAQHDQANAMMLAGRSNPAPDAPSFGAMVTKLRPSFAKIPPHVWLQKYGGGAAPPEQTYLSGGRLGAAVAPMLIGKQHDENPASDDFRVRAFDRSQGISQQRLKTRWQLTQKIQNSSNTGKTSEYDRLDLYQRKSFDLLDSTKAKEAFDIKQEPSTIRERYGQNPLGQNLVLARRLVEAGVRLVNVLAWTGLAPQEKFVSVETWDMHGNADVGIFEDGWNGLPFALPRADQAVATLLTDLEERGLLETTLVVLCGEFGRTPKISRGAKRIGRDHWPNCYSALVAGGGIQGGVVYGESDKQGAYVKSNPVSLEDFTATLFSAMKIDPTSRLSPDGFTLPASTGDVIGDLF